VTGEASEIGPVLSTHPLVRKLSFTGSTEVGKLLIAQASGTVKKVTMELGGQLTATQAKTVLAELVEPGGDPAAIAADKGFEAMDSSELDSLVDGLIADHPDEWQRFCEGDGKITGFFVGKVMKATQGKADGKVVTSLLNARKG
jgi:aspartyl-tRNA(Asn)/glutamyl-tRNA(Gln) amidotransferase subunit B